MGLDTYLTDELVRGKSSKCSHNCLHAPATQPGGFLCRTRPRYTHVECGKSTIGELIIREVCMTRHWQATAKLTTFSFSWSSWKTTTTRPWTPKTSGCPLQCLQATDCWPPWRPSTAPRPTTGPATGRNTGLVPCIQAHVWEMNLLLAHRWV